MSNKIKNIVGKRFGNLLIIDKYFKNNKYGKTLWVSKCDCGKEKIISKSDLRTVKSCGCLSCGEDISGKKFEYLTVVKKTNQKNKTGKYLWLCRCNCGNERLGTASQLRFGAITSCGCKRRGENNPNWTGGKRKDKNTGYVILTDMNHPNASPSRHTVAEHIVVMSDYLGRPLRKGEVVHHKNGIRDDNRIENLELWTKAHPSGQRAIDLLQYAEEIIKIYSPLKEKLKTE